MKVSNMIYYDIQIYCSFLNKHPVFHWHFIMWWIGCDVLVNAHNMWSQDDTFNFLFSVSNLALVKPEKANAVENYLIQMARFGKLGGKVRKCSSDASTR